MNSLQPVKTSGGVCAALGFSANGIHAGFKKSDKKDVALIFSQKKAVTVAVYTKNLVKGAPLTVTKANIADGFAQAVVCNSGNANTCNYDGVEKANEMCGIVAEKLGIDKTDVVVASTGVIGKPFDLSPIKSGINELANGLTRNGSSAAEAIMTTDTQKKEIAFAFEIDGVECHIGGMAKGSGMIHPNMATMLVFVTTDVCIGHDALYAALKNDVEDSFNMISVDGDTSTNDMVTLMANGCANNPEIKQNTKEYKLFCKALAEVTGYLCRRIAADGEGATKLLECEVTGAADKETAKTCAKAVICSSLVKAAMFGADANWGRVLCALGYCGAKLDVTKIDVAFSSKAGEISVCKNGAGVEFSEPDAKRILCDNEITIKVNLNAGVEKAQAFGCDLTYDYVKINGDYRT